jgi:type VI secretion system protein ImpA
MSTIDVNGLLTEVTPDQPCGDNLEYDPAFSELERAARGKEEQSLGDASVAAEPPDWRDVRNRSTELLERTRDLRVTIYLIRSLLNTDGLVGFADGIALLRGLLERYWECVHPQLDPEDDNDPTFRMNTLVTLCDRDATLMSLQEAALVSSRAMGRYGLRHVHIARGEVPTPSGEDAAVADMASIDGAFMDADLDELQATADAITRCSGDLAAIDSILMEQVGSAQAPNLDDLTAMLKSMQTIMSEQLARRGVGEAPEAAGDQPAAIQSVSGEINSREDAIRMMEKISDYFQRHEPSSPVPMMMQRSKRLVSMSFMEILKELAPDGVSQASSVGGISKD